MSQKLDIAKMEAAFKRAAHKALHGTREERSGKFLPKNKGQSRRGAHPDAPKDVDLAKRKARKASSPDEQSDIRGQARRG